MGTSPRGTFGPSLGNADVSPPAVSRAPPTGRHTRATRTAAARARAERVIGISRLLLHETPSCRVGRVFEAHRAPVVGLEDSAHPTRHFPEAVRHFFTYPVTNSARWPSTSENVPVTSIT